MLSEELMQKVRQLQILTARMVSEVFSGEYSSAFRGRGMEFDEVREYQPGDDIRTIDWNVTARSGVPHVKRFIEERELTILFAVDMSSSGQFGSVERLKNETAAELCAVLAFAATRNNDKVGLLLFTDRVELFIPPKKGTRHVLRLIRELLSFEVDRSRRHGTDITFALEHLARLLKRRSVIFLVSDFLVKDMVAPTASDRPAELETAIRLTNRRHDLVSIAIEDPREIELPRMGLVELEDAETGARSVIDTSSRRVRHAWRERAQRHRDRLAQVMRRSGCDFVTVRTGEPYIHTLIELFRRREHRR